MKSTSDERVRIEMCSQHANYSSGVMRYAINYCGRIFKSFMIPGGVLELGPAEGVMTDFLFHHFPNDYTIVDGADFFVSSLQKRYPSMKCYRSLFEEFQPERTYENIILGHVLEHVEKPVQILKLCNRWLTEQGRILAAVPNSESVHRQVAVQMGLLESTKQLNATDLKNGHRRVYDKSTLEHDFLQAGLDIIKSGGYWMKPLSNAQIDKSWTKDMVESFLMIGEKYPEIAAEIYVIAEKTSHKNIIENKG